MTSAAPSAASSLRPPHRGACSVYRFVCVMVSSLKRFSVVEKPPAEERFELRQVIKVRLLHTAGMGEGMIDERIGDRGRHGCRRRVRGRGGLGGGAGALDWQARREADTLRAVAPAPHANTNRTQWDAVFGLADSVSPARLVLDIRENLGGNGFLNRYPVQQILRRPALDRPDRLEEVPLDPERLEARAILLAEVPARDEHDRELVPVRVAQSRRDRRLGRGRTGGQHSG